LEVRDFYNNKSQKNVPPPPELIEYMLVEKFGWTLDYIRSLEKKDIDNLFIIMSEKNQAGTANREC